MSKTNTPNSSAKDVLGSMPDTSSASYADRSPILTAFDHFCKQSDTVGWFPSCFLFSVSLRACLGCRRTSVLFLRVLATGD